MVEEHGGDMSARDKKDARRIQADFEFEEVGTGGRRGRRDRGDREREREPPPHDPPRANAAGARRRDAFGGNLTTVSSTPATPNAGPSRNQSRRQSPSPTADMDPAVAEYVYLWQSLLLPVSDTTIHYQTADCGIIPR